LITACGGGGGGGGGGESNSKKSTSDSDPTLSSISVSSFSAHLKVGETQQLIATSLLTDDSSEDISNQVTWSSSEISIATVSGSGLVTSISAGIATITASFDGIQGSTQGTMIALESLAITPINSLEIANSLQLAVTGTYTDDSTEDFSSLAIWSSSDTDRLTVSDTGLISTIVAGTVTVSASYEDTTATIDANIIPPEVSALSSISVTSLPTSMKTGETRQLSATGLYTNGDSIDLTNSVEWLSSNSSAATVDPSGLVTFIAIGSVTITATSAGIEEATSSDIIALTSLFVSEFSDTLITGATEQFSVTATYSDSSSEDLSNTATWSSSDTDVASISSSGLLTTITSGSVSITASFGSFSDTASGNVITLTGLTISDFSGTLITGATEQFSATATYSDSSTEDLTNTATWLSSDPSVASISSSGLLTTISSGSVNITASFAGFSDSASGNVITRTDLTISNFSGTLKTGATEQFSAIATYSDSSTEDLSNSATWSSSDSGIASISTSGLLTTLSAGSVNITASFGGLSDSASGNVIALTTLTVNDFSGTLKTGVTEQFSATATYSDSSTEDLTNTASWSSSDTDIASISSSGLLTTLSAGSVNITASFGGFSDTAPGSIITLNSITINALSHNLKIGESEQLVATGTYSDSSTENLSSNVTWLSSDSNIASLSSTGLLTSVAIGTVVLSASNSEFEGLLNATMIDLSSISISPPSSTLAKSTSQQFIATGIYSDDTSQDLSSLVNWVTGDNDLATTSNTGLLRAVSDGATTITASLNSTSGSANVTVTTVTLQDIEISAPNAIPANTSEQIMATGIYSDDSTQDLTNQVSWSTHNSAIATIQSASGLATFIKKGTVLIYASLDDITTQSSITVSDANITSIVITPSNISLANGTTENVSIVAIFSDNSHLDISSQAEWSSNDNTIADIEDFTSNVSANAIGSTIITASFSGQTATLNTTVTSAILTSFDISPITTTIPAGLSQQFTANGLYSDGSIQDLTSQVTWTSNNDTLASIGNSSIDHGLAQSTSAGTVTISAILGDINQSTSLIVENITLSSIELSPPNQSLAIGLTSQVNAYGHYSDGSIIEINDLVSWSSALSSIASFSASQPGKVTPLTEGETIINAELDGITALGEITVTAATLQSIDINANSSSLPSGYEQTLTATGTFSDASTSDISKLVTWQSSDPSVLSIDNSITSFGLTRGISAGISTVSANFNNISTSTDITITSATLSTITISLTQTSLNDKAQTTATALASYSDDSSDDITQQVIWGSSNSNIASIQNTAPNGGLITGHSAGTASISASLNGVTADSINIEITENPNTPISLQLSVTPFVILANGLDTSNIEATVLPADDSGTIADGTQVVFTITEGDTITIQSNTTVNGVTSIETTSSHEGLIIVEASIEENNTSNIAGLFSTNNLASVLSTSRGTISATFSEGVLAKDSRLILIMRNITNRVFSIQQVEASYGAENARTEFPGSPYTALNIISDGTLSEGETTIFVYDLDTDIEASLFHIIYSLTDVSSGTLFEKHIDYNFE